MDFLASVSGAAKRKVKTYNSFVGFCFIINFIVGTGFLGVPYVFWHTGIIAGVVVLIAVSYFVAVPALWTLEIMSRAQALESRVGNLQESCDLQHPQYEINTHRRFEVRELCHIFLGKRVGTLYMVMVMFYMWLAQWLTAPVAGTAWSSLLPLDFGVFRQCNEDEFQGVYHPSGGCWNSYALCILLFAIVVVPISCLDIKEQEIFQLVLAMLRFFLLGTLVIYSIVAEVTNHHLGDKQEIAASSKASIPWTHFNVQGLLAAIPVVVYAQMFHVAIPTVTQPISDKTKLVWLYLAVFTTTTIIYGTLGVTVAMYQRDEIIEVCTLNWKSLTTNSNVPLRILGYFIVLFPTLDVCSAYPLTVVVMANTVEYLITGDASKTPDRITRTVHRFFWAVFPLIGGVYLSDIVELDKYSGLLAFFMAFWFPAILQYKSQKECARIFGYSNTPYSSWYSGTPFIVSVFAVGVIVTIATFVGFVLPGSLS